MFVFTTQKKAGNKRQLLFTCLINIYLAFISARDKAEYLWYSHNEQVTYVVQMCTNIADMNFSQVQAAWNTFSLG